MLVFSQIIVAISIVIISNRILLNNERFFIVQMTIICMIIVNSRLMLLYILQSTNRIKEYSVIITLDRVLYLGLLIVFLGFGIREFKFMIFSDLVAKFIALIFSAYYCKEIVYRRFSDFSFQIKETMVNICVGAKLMLSNIASLLIIGTVRFGIERSWDVTTFGKISLTLSISNLLMIFINALGMILFPVLRRIEETKIPRVYVTMRNLFSIIILGLLVAYYPLKIILSSWLPNYADSLIYMAILFPMIMFEGKMSFLINTYLRTLRLENLILKINIVALIVSVLCTLISSLMFKSLDLAVLSIIIVLGFRSVLAEILLSKTLKVSFLRDVILELTVIVSFILSAWFINSWLSFLLQILLYGCYILIKRYDVVRTIREISLLMRDGRA